MLAIGSGSNELSYFLVKIPSDINANKNEKLNLKLQIQTYQILTNDHAVYIPSLFSILLTVRYWDCLGCKKSRTKGGVIYGC